MKRPIPTTAPPPKTLTEQKNDFTAEGAPPPGRVASDEPASTEKAPPVPPKTPAVTRKRPAAPRRR